MTSQERKITLTLASIYSFRMLGLFMILPIFSLYTTRLTHANPSLIGLALGIYGLTQAILQIPFGMTSDRIGRKPVILFGLILFLVGSVIAASSHDIYGIIIGRAFQGAGAIGSTLIALLADTTDEENRLKAMSMIGMTIGFSFMIAMVLGPIVNAIVGLAGIFWLTALLSILGMAMLRFIPTPRTHLLHRDSEPVLSQFRKILAMPELLRLNFGIFSLHAMLMALFIVIPTALLHSSSLDQTHQWLIYLPILLIACVLMFPFVILAEAKRLMKPILSGAILVLVLTLGLLGSLAHQIFILSILLCLFFTAFTLLEGILPSLISKIAPAGNKGTAMGIYSSAQFLGIFCGGSLGGLLFHHHGEKGVFLFCGLLGLIWFCLAVTMKQPPYLSSRIVKIGEISPAESQTLRTKLLALPGVADVMIATEEQVAYLKIDRKYFEEKQLSRIF